MPRPKFVPTPELREMVRSHAAVGTPQKVIARMLKVRSPKTIRKYFRDELDLGLAEANATVAGSLYKNATEGRDTHAQKFWLLTRGGWGKITCQSAPAAPPPFIVAVEEKDAGTDDNQDPDNPGEDAA